eukprot:c34904_g1_i1 orf=51-314(+)
MQTSGNSLLPYQIFRYLGIFDTMDTISCSYLYAKRKGYLSMNSRLPPIGKFPNPLISFNITPFLPKMQYNHSNEIIDVNLFFKAVVK